MSRFDWRLESVCNISRGILFVLAHRICSGIIMGLEKILPQKMMYIKFCTFSYLVLPLESAACQPKYFDSSNASNSSFLIFSLEY